MAQDRIDDGNLSDAQFSLQGKAQTPVQLDCLPLESFSPGPSQGVPAISIPDRAHADSLGLQSKQMISGQEWKHSWDKKTLLCKNSMKGNYNYSSHQNIFCIPSSR